MAGIVSLQLLQFSFYVLLKKYPMQSIVTMIALDIDVNLITWILFI